MSAFSAPAPAMCLSIQQPWAWLILHVYKDIENRSWFTDFRGPIYVHAAEELDEDALDWFELYFAKSVQIPKFGKSAPTVEMEPVYRGSQLGGIVGEVEILGCVTSFESEWFAGDEYNFVLANPKLLTFVPCDSEIRDFTVPTHGKNL